MSERFDAVIVGAGLSGQACAHRLRAGGMSVALAIRAEMPIAVLHDALEQFPRYSDAYLRRSIACSRRACADRLIRR